MIEEWLHEHGLGKYMPVFAEHEVDLAALPYLTEDDLKELGLPLGPRRKLLAAIATLVEQPGKTIEQPTARSLPPTVERRQLTVLFCDLVGSTELSGRHDPEDMREVLRRYQDTVAGVLSHHDGYVANYLGDGVLAYFGWPKADEDQAAHAARGGLAAVEAVAALTAPDGQPLAARVGIATGQVVVGDLEGGTARQAGAVSGETPNLAARLQAVAAAGEVVVSDETRRLMGRQFELEPLGVQVLKGIARPIPAWRVARELVVESRFAARGGELTRFVGREHELGLLLERWRQSAAGEGQTVLLSGEAGIGKSRLLQELQECLAGEDCLCLRYQCEPHYTNSAFYPVIKQLERAWFDSGDCDGMRLDKLEALVGSKSDAAQLLAALLSLPFEHRYGPLDLAPEARKERTLQALVNHLLTLAAQRPVVLLFEDAHWIDPSTEELLGEMVACIAVAPVLVLITHRPEWQAPWTGQPRVTTLGMARLGRDEAAEIVQELAGAHVGDEAILHIVERTDGIPLFVEELTKALVERGLDSAEADIPASLQASLTARLDRLGPTVKEIAQIGAVIGREFGHDVLAAVAARPDETLRLELNRLLQSGLVFRTGSLPHARYSFKHALVQDAAYDSLLKRQRQVLHLKIARALRDLAPETEATEPALLAHHYEEGGDADAAIRYWSQAGDLASRRSAVLEAVAHYRRALAVLPRTAETSERNAHELHLNVKLGNALMQAYGYTSADAQEAWERGRRIALDRSIIDDIAVIDMTPMLFARGKFREALQVLESLNDEQGSTMSPVARIHRAAGLSVVHLCLGQLDAAWRSNEEARELDAVVRCSPENPFAGGDPAIVLRSYGAWIRSAQGFPEHGNCIAREAVEITSNYEHAFSRIWAQLVLVRSLVVLGCFQQAIEIATAAMEAAERRGFAARVGNLLIHRGQALSASGEIDRGISEMTRGITLWEERGGLFHLSEWSASGASSALAAGRLQEAKDMLEKAEKVMNETGELVAEADIIRLHGAFAGLNGDLREAGRLFRTAITVAQGRGAMFQALRAATAAAQLYSDAKRPEQAVSVLQPVYDWFTEGFSTPDLVQAKVLLDQLGCAQSTTAVTADGIIAPR